MWLIVYIDDIHVLLLAESEEKARDHASGLVYLLQCLEFTISIGKSVLMPSQSVEFLSFTINTVTMELSLHAEK